MVRAFLATAATAAAVAGIGTAIAIAAAGDANAEPPPGETDVPGMHYDAALGTTCSNWDRYVFGRAPNGQALACVGFDGQGTWVLSAPLRGVQTIGESCPPGDATAQSPDGLALMCVYGQGWQPGS
jgi:hypothetical protein